MRRSCAETLVAVCFATVAAQALFAQPPQARRANDTRGLPAIGQRLPDIQGYDADGNQFKLRSLEGKYTVLVFGCLT